MKIGITIVTHHKPFLIKSSLNSLSSQSFKNYDLNFIFIKGSGIKKTKTYRRFNLLASKLKNSRYQLSMDSKEVFNIIKNYKKTNKIHIYDNNQSLDSGAWIKYISKKTWNKYDYTFFLMEGFLFKNKYALEDAINFIKNKKPNMIMLGSELIFHTKKVVKKLAHNPYEKNINKKKMNDYHQHNIDKVLKEFGKVNNLKIIINNWKKYNFFRKDNNDIVINFVSTNYFNFFKKMRLYIKYIIKEKNIFNPFQKKIFYSEGDFRYLIPTKFLNLKLFKKNIYLNNISAHLINSPFFFVNGCQHIYSKEYLSTLAKNFKKYNLVNFVYNTPFSGSSLEIIWGLLPSAFKFEKWYLDCLHRPRKNFYNYIREDTKKGMKKYMKMYGINHE